MTKVAQARTPASRLEGVTFALAPGAGAPRARNAGNAALNVENKPPCCGRALADCAGAAAGEAGDDGAAVRLHRPKMPPLPALERPERGEG